MNTDRTSLDSRTEFVDELSATGDPVQIGNYRILHRLGEGGMGIVYLAEQERPIRRRVALKVIKLGMDIETVIARFEAERQALARMAHSNVAKVFHAGSTEHGRPYFVMEYVEGVPITDYCDRHRLSTCDRLQLFTQVCEGVQHAHQKGIIHRDIKPSNVLVTVQGDKPLPKIIDFGVAKATQQRLTEKTVFTQMGALIGTPVYMSPEQMELTALDIDTRADVYSLGVMLYELLVGALPFGAADLREVGFDEFRRRIREDEPSKPSTKLATLGDRSAESASRRRTEVSSLRRQLLGDLDWIVMKALEKDRTRRYGSPNELAADIGRHLRHEPVVAGPPGTAYRMRKFTRRHRLGVVASAAVFVALALGVVGTTIGLVRATRAEAEARREAVASETVSEFLVGLFQVSDPSEARGNTITAREILDRGAERIESELTEQPLVQARLMTTIGRVYWSLGLAVDAEPFLERAWNRQAQLLGEDHPRTLNAASGLASAYWGQGRFEESESLRVETLEAWRRLRGDDNPRTIQAAASLAHLYYSQTRSEEAASLYEKTLETSHRVLGDDDPITLELMQKLGMAYAKLRRFDEAERLHLDALEGLRRVRGNDHPVTLAAAGDLGLLYQEQGRWEEAESIYLEVLEAFRRIYDEGHPDIVKLLSYIATTYQDQGRFDEAEPIYLEALEGQRRTLGEEHPETVLSAINLAVLYCRLGRFDECEPHLVESLETARHGLGDDHEHTLLAMTNLGLLYGIQNRLDEAEPLQLETLDAKRRVFGANHPATVQSFGILQGLYDRTNRPERARDLLVEQLQLMYLEALPPDATAEMKITYARMALTCEPEDLRDPKSALTLASKANELTKYESPDHLGILALAQHLTGDTRAAIETQEKAIALLSADDPRLEASRAQLSEFEASRPRSDT